MTPPPYDGGLGFYLLAALLVLSVRWDVGPIALAGLFLVGIEERFFAIGTGYSDVAVVTRAAIDMVTAHGNPYGVGYQVTTPPGAPFAYGPLTLLWYFPFHDPRVAELLVAGLILLFLSVRGRPLGLALYATSPMLVRLVSDGSNDTSAGLFLLIALVVLERSPRVGAFLLGVASAFKPYALAWLPPIFIWAGLGALIAGLLGAALFWLPAVLIWGFGPILKSFQLSDSTKQFTYYSLGMLLERFHVPANRDALNAFRLFVGGLTAVVGSIFAKSHGAVVVIGAAIYVVTLFAGFWSTAAYLQALAPVLCWYADTWLEPLAGPAGVGDAAAVDDPTRVRWPSDPIGRLIDAVNERWPIAARA